MKASKNKCQQRPHTGCVLAVQPAARLPAVIVRAAACAWLMMINNSDLPTCTSAALSDEPCLSNQPPQSTQFGERTSQQSQQVDAAYLPHIPPECQPVGPTRSCALERAAHWQAFPPIPAAYPHTVCSSDAHTQRGQAPPGMRLIALVRAG